MLKNNAKQNSQQDEVSLDEQAENLAMMLKACEETVVNGKTLMAALREGGYFKEKEQVN